MRYQVVHYLAVLFFLFFFQVSMRCHDIQAEDGSLWGDSDEELDKESDLDREWQRRHDQFHTVLDNLDFLFIQCQDMILFYFILFY